MKKPLVIVKLEAWISFLIPLLSGLSAGGVLLDTPYGKIIALLCSSIVAGLSGLKAYVSTTFATSLAPDVAAVSPVTENKSPVSPPLTPEPLRTDSTTK
jgi:hypothetical protein